MKDAAESFDARLAEIRAANPALEAAEVYVTDLNTTVRGKLVPIEMLAKLGQGRMRLPTSSLALDIFSMDVAEAGLALERGDPDGILVPIADSVAPMLWTDRPTLQVQCMLAEPDGMICTIDPRGVLMRVIEKATAMALTPVMALELEFYLIDAERAAPPTNPLAGGRLNRAQVYDLDVMRAFAPVIDEIGAAARALGAPADTAICEFGPGQFEINLAHTASAMRACDHIVALRRAIRGVARRHGLDATFMAKPFGDMAGSGQHLHLSLLGADGAPIFAMSAPEGGPNATLRAAVAGVLDSLGEAMLLQAPHLNSYRRFSPGSYAPLVAAWGLDNRGVAVRLPESTGPAARLEARLAGADANPYLLAAAVLAGALAGIQAGSEPPPPIAAEAGPGDGAPLPLSWAMAEHRFSQSAFAADWLGTEFARVYGAMKRQERATLMSRVPDIEYDAYLRTV
ncbi:MAG: glutamine synthetase family protein [Pseudomonadota bacterium]